MTYPLGIHPIISIALISLGIVVLMEFIMRKFTDRKFVKGVQGEINNIRSSLKGLSVNDKSFKDANSRMMSLNSKLMMHRMKPMLFSMLPLFLVLQLVGNTFSGFGDLIPLPFSLPLVGGGLGWLGTYILFAFLFSIVIRKVWDWGENRAEAKSENNS